MLVVLGWALINSQAQMYPDFIVDILSEHGGNKTGELIIWWSTFLIGASLILILKKRKNRKNKIPTTSPELKPILIIEGITCFANSTILILSGNVNLYLTAISIIVFKLSHQS